MRSVFEVTFSRVSSTIFVRLVFGVAFGCESSVLSIFERSVFEVAFSCVSFLNFRALSM